MEKEKHLQAKRVKNLARAAQALLFVGATLLCLSAWAESFPAQVRLQLKWQHQFQFAGYYAAKELGYYREAGLDVEIIPAVPGMDSVDQVLSGKAEYGVGTTDLLLRRWRGEPVVALAVIFQHSPLVLLTKKQDAIRSLHDLAGKPVMIEPGSAELLAYLRREGLTESRIRLTKHSWEPQDLIADRVAAMSAYVTDEPFELVSKGIDFQVFSPRTGGIDFYGDNLFTTESELSNQPERVKAFRAASLRGWEYAMRHPEEIANLIHERYSPRHSIEHLLFEAGKMEPLLQIALVETGHMYPGRWRHIAEVYAELGMLQGNMDMDGFLYDPHPPPPDLTRLYIGGGILLVVVLGLAALSVYIHRTNRRLSASEERYRVVYETAPVAFILSNHKFDIIDWNQAAEKIFGWKREEALGRNAYQLLVPESELEQVRKVVGDVMQEKQAATHSVNWNVTRDGDRILCEWDNVMRHDDDGNLVGVLSLGVDITARKRLEDNLRQARQNAEHALDEHRQFLGMVSHEFRTPLATISAAAQVLDDRCGNCDKAPTGVIARIRRATERLALFLDNSLSDSRFETHCWALQVEAVDLSALVLGVVGQTQLLAAGHEFGVELGSLPEKFYGDHELLRIMLRNLLENAVKYSPPGSTVTVSAAFAGAPSMVRLTVTDAGLGLLDEEREKIYTRYFRGRQAGRTPGMGLGLSLVKRIVELHGGKISADNAPARGATFAILLPTGEAPK